MSPVYEEEAYRKEVHGEDMRRRRWMEEAYKEEEA